MTAESSTYQKTKAAIRRKKVQEYLMDDELLDEACDLALGRRKIDVVDAAKIGTGVIIGGGIGILSGVAAVALSANAVGVAVGGLVTKVAGAVGGAAGLGWGLKSVEKKYQVQQPQSKTTGGNEDGAKGEDKGE